jgi:hypothetical protein
VLSCLLIVSRHARRFALLPASRRSIYHRHSQPSKSHQILSFAGPHPLTLLESYRFKNMAGRGYSLPSDLQTFRRANVPHSPRSFPYLVTSLSHYFLASSSLSPLAATLMDLPASVANKRLTTLAKPFRCNTYKNHGGGVHLFRIYPPIPILELIPFCTFSFLFNHLQGPHFATPFFSNSCMEWGGCTPPLFRPPSPRRRQASTHLRAIIGPAASASAKKASQE